MLASVIGEPPGAWHGVGRKLLHPTSAAARGSPGAGAGATAALALPDAATRIAAKATRAAGILTACGNARAHRSVGGDAAAEVDAACFRIDNAVLDYHAGTVGG